MSFDLSWLWETLNSITSTLSSWFSGIWDVVETIGNTGQGIFSGLVAFGSQLWDGIIKALGVFGEWIYNAFNYIYMGLIGLGNAFGEWLSNAFTWLASGIQWVASGVYSFGNWLYNGLVFVINWIINSIQAIWNNIIAWFSGVATSISEFWGSVTSSVNSWFTNLILGFRTKMVETITADLTISLAWKSAERFMNFTNIKEIGYGLIGILSSPVIGRLVGEIINSIIPTPTTSTYPLIPTLPSIEYTPPSLEIETPTEPTPPSGISTPAVYGFRPVVEATPTIYNPTLLTSLIASSGQTLNIPNPTYQVEVA